MENVENVEKYAILYHEEEDWYKINLVGNGNIDDVHTLSIIIMNQQVFLNVPGSASRPPSVLAVGASQEEKQEVVVARSGEDAVHRPTVPGLPWPRVLRRVAERPTATGRHEG